MSVRHVRLLLSGYGRVGRAFVALLAEKHATLVKTHDLDLRLVAIATRSGAAIAPRGQYLPLDLILSGVLPGTSPADLPHFGQPGRTVRDLLEHELVDVLVEATPTDIETGGAALGHTVAALERGVHVVTATKGPLVRGYGPLHQLAAANGAALGYSAATAAALPTLDVANYALAGTRILAIEGILNGTTNFVLTRMEEQSEPMAEALAEAQRLGIAEPDPRLDIEGWDTANKLILIANSSLGASLTLRDVAVSGIASVMLDSVQSAVARGERLKLVGRAEVAEGVVKASVGTVALGADHPLAAVRGTEKGITFTTDTMGRVTVIGGKSDPRGAAAALLKDLLHLPGGPGPVTAPTARP